MDDYVELMRPLFQRLGGDAENLLADESPLNGSPGPQLQSSQNLQLENSVATLHRSAMSALEVDILAHIYAQTPQFFENLIIDLLLAMGYGNRRRDLAKRLGRSHDGGIDGAISQDELGLDVILVQAKRLRPGNSVTVSQVRDFVGSLDTRRAQKGIFVTTGEFTMPARLVAQDVSRRVVLINGQELAALMVRHNLGVSVSESYVFKTLQLDYFTSAATHVTAVRSSASSQLRK